MSVDIETLPHVKDSKRPKAQQGKYVPYLMSVVAYTGVTNEGEIRSFAFQLLTEKSPFASPPAHLSGTLRAIRELNDLPVRKTMHNGVYDSAWFLRYQCSVRNYAYDSMTMWWAKYPDLPKTLDFVSSILLDDHRYWKMGRKDQDFMRHTAYAMSDTETTLRCTIYLLQWMRDDPIMRRNFQEAHMRCLAGLGMSMKGARVDQDVRMEMWRELEKESEEKLESFRALVRDPDVNPASPKQMQELFYGVLGAKPRNAKGRELKRVTKANRPSTGFLALRAMEQEHPILKRVIASLNEAKKPAKQISNVIKIEYPEDGRFRSAYHGTGTTTSRYSSSADAFGFGSNAQNIRKKYRKIVRSDENSILLEVDFSAADDVFVSYESEEPKKIWLVESGQDSHSFNAANVFFTNWEYEEVVAGKKTHDPRIVDPITGIRQITKKVTHGANYLMAGMTLLMSAGRDAIVAAAKVAGHEDAETWDTIHLAKFCETLDRAYRIFYPRFAREGKDSFYSELQHNLMRTGGFITCFNYGQRFINDPMDQATLRAVAASVGQANTAGRVNMAMDELVHGVRIARFRDGPAPDPGPALWINEESYGASVRFQTHDSLTFNIDLSHPNWQEGVERIYTVMRRPVVCKGREVNVGIEGDVGIWWAHDTQEVNSAEDIVKWVKQDSQSQHFHLPSLQL